MKSRLAITAVLILLEWFTLGARGAVVTFAWTNFDGTVSTNDLIVTAVTQPLNDGSYTIKGLPVRFPVTNGLASKILLGGNFSVVPYSLSISPVLFAVPNDANTYNFWDLRNSGGNTYVYSPGVQKIYAGNNITIVATNGNSANSGNIVINSTGGGSGVSVAATAPVTAVTNSSLVTLALQFVPMLASANLTNFSVLTTNFFYPSNNPAGFIPSNAIPNLYGYVTNAVTTNTATGLTNVVTSIIGLTPITGLSNVRSGTPANGFVLTYQNGVWTNLPTAGTNTFVAAGANVTVTTNGSANLYTIAASSPGANVAVGNGVTLSTNAGVVTVNTNGQTLSWTGQTNWPLSQITNAAANRFSTNADNISINGATLTNLSATELRTGTVADARLSANIPRLNAVNTFANNVEFTSGVQFDSTIAFLGFVGFGSSVDVGSTGAVNSTNQFQVVNPSGQVEFQVTTNGGVYMGTNRQWFVTPAGNVTFSGVATGDGSGLTNLVAGNIASGAIPQARFPTNLLLYSGAGSAVTVKRASTGATIFNADNDTGNVTGFASNWNLKGDGSFTFGGGAVLGDATGIVSPLFTGNGSALTNLNGSKISSGTVADARLSANVPLLNAANVFTASNSIAGAFTGNGAGLTNLPGLTQANIAAAAVTNAGNLIYSNATAVVLSSSGNATNLTSKATLTADSITATNLKSSALTTQRVLVSDNGSPPSITNLPAGGVNTILHGTTPPAFSAVAEGDLSFTDITTANASTSAHGLAPKYPNDGTKYLNGLGAYTVPSATSTDSWKTNGNAGLPGGSFIGTTDAHDFTVKANNKRVMFVDELGAVNKNNNVTFGQLNSIITNSTTYGNVILNGGSATPNYITNGTENAIVGGDGNIISSDVTPTSCAIIAGSGNMITNSIRSVIAGGSQNALGSHSGYSGIFSGWFNTINRSGETGASIVGGVNNTNSSSVNGIILGGSDCAIANVSFGFATGNRAKVNHAGSAVFADSVVADFASTAANQFSARYAGGTYWNVGSTMIGSNSLANWPTAPRWYGDFADVNSNGYPYRLLSTNGGVGSLSWTGTNKLGW